ncbi:unnamed protein product [Oppiella nova]|uniref:Uncharacterized protein n=1 Tax=Oppiella nova TaxID=334625 RepID=A0A7R9LZG7_9ACAR|nr:unnamed protein product [Oppiella nova]CAG2168410.1 unnamed protein product [Oppiella nova]
MKTSQNEVKCKNYSEDSAPEQKPSLLSPPRPETAANYSEDSAPEQKPSLLSPPRPETAAVMVSLTSDDKISMDASKLKSTTTDDTSLVVHLDDTHSDMDGDPEGANSSDINDSRDTNEKKSIRKSINESNSDSKSESNENKNSTEELNNSSKDSNKLSEKDSSKSKSLRYVMICGREGFSVSVDCQRYIPNHQTESCDFGDLTFWYSQNTAK